MKRFNLLVWLLLLLSATSFSQIQHIKIVSFTVKNQLPATIDTWNTIPGALLLVAQKAPPARLEGIRLVLQIKSNGAIICGTNPATGMQVDNFTTRTFQAGELTSMLGGCHDLKEGNYMLCAQFFNIDKVAVSDEACKPFIVEAAKDIEYNPPTLITPDNGKVFSSIDMQKPVMFRWTPLVPKPREPVTYRLRVWQLMQGQNSLQAMRSNQPMLTKEVDNITQAVVTNIYNGPCKPPYLCDFVWSIQAVNKDRKPMGRNEGTSEPYTFSVNAAEEILPPVNITPANNNEMPAELFFDTYEEKVDVKKGITFTWNPVSPNQSAPVTYKLRVWQLMQGQNGQQAMKSNQPISTKEVLNNTTVTVAGIYTGPCKPPYLCDFVWIVEATIGNAAGQTHQTVSSEPTVFTIKEKVTVKPPVNVYPENSKAFKPDEVKGSVTFRWKPVEPRQSSPVTYRLKVWQLMQGQNGQQAMKSNPPIVTKDVDNLTEATVAGIYTGPCKPPYLCDFIWSVEATIGNAAGQTRTTVSSEPTTFTVTNDGDISTDFIRPPVNIIPEDKKTISPEDAKRAITFKWKPVEPKQSAPVTYRLKVWQLMQGQSGAQAMKSNQPIATKEVKDLTETTVLGIYTGPCKPPYLCDFIWNVEATIGNAPGQTHKTLTSEPTMFAVSQYIIQLDSIKVSCTAKPGVFSFSYTITNPNVGPATLNQFTVTSSTPAGASIASFGPPINTVIAAGNQLTITGTINAPVNLSNICIGAEIKDVGNAFWKASKDTCVNVGPCKCDACDSAKIEIVQKDIKFDNNGNINLNTNFTAGPKKVKSVKTELVYYEYKPESDDCMLCNKDSKTFGNFDNSTLGNTSGIGSGTHSLVWNFIPPKNLAGGTGLSMTITVPPTVKCCDALIRWCIRYVVTFEDCTVCNKLICYEKKKEGCAKGNPNPNNDQK